MFTVNETASIATMLAAYNEVAPKARKSFKDKPSAVAALTALGLAVVANSTLADQVLTETEDRKAPGRKTDVTKSTIVYAGAPIFSRPNSTRHKRLAIMAECHGRTVAEFYAATRQAGVPANAKLVHRAVNKGFITLA